ncbi:MAG: SAM-dependent DNA methyltransferase [Candidatus Micrarchaeota archaeon]|nr:SAM-dependent DNA methyltransferase [Candidatus Micrarchaeota archaeon]
MLDIKTLENWLWDAACKIRGEIDAPKYKDYILPLIFLKRLSDVYEDDVAKLTKEYGDIKTSEELIEEDHSLVWFYLPKKTRWSFIIKQTTKLGETLTDAVRSITKENPKLQGVIDIVDFNATTAGQRIISDEKLRLLIDTLDKHRLGLNDVEPDILGRAYEYLLRKFAEGSGQSAGEFYTPGEVAILMANIVDPEQGNEVYDPCLGSAGLLIKCHLRFVEKYGDNTKIKPLRFYGQEVLPPTYAMAKMNTFIHQMSADIALGDTMNRPAFLSQSGALKKFDIVLANPMWNQDFSQNTYENDTYNRFVFGYPQSSSADWGWVQHMFASLNNKGRMAVVLDTGAVSRGSGNEGSSRERDIRKGFVERDLIEAVILMPENLFYNTPSAGIILIINKDKKFKNKILLINASKLLEKRRPKNFIPENEILHISNIYKKFKVEDSISKIVSNGDLAKNDYNISPSRYISQNGNDKVLPLDEAVTLLKAAEEERKHADKNLNNVFEQMGFEV